jgi:hypothetical protein
MGTVFGGVDPARAYCWGMAAVGELVRSTSGAWMVRPPLRCPRGHPLRPGRMLVGSIACSCGRHLTWCCECGAVIYGSAPSERCSLLDGTPRISAEHHPGVGTVRGHVLDMSTRVISTGGDGIREIVPSRVVDRVDPDGPPANLRAQRVDERFSDPANTGWIIAAAGEYHLDVGAWISQGGRNADGCIQQCQGCHHCGAKDTSDLACALTSSTLTYFVQRHTTAHLADCGHETKGRRAARQRRRDRVYYF